MANLPALFMSSLEEHSYLVLPGRGAEPLADTPHTTDPRSTLGSSQRWSTTSISEDVRLDNPQLHHDGSEILIRSHPVFYLT
ncbi:hypothetical protein B296_00028628 [Ensete ventricosum]|uniref:Uncharacterized protein n=1 Tax=Ensete ventricosum TaxID=4639 RepID=A0A426XXB0_ENSVE|nr:hypothetical protein B296_00028628 [Ensete ventricosum]